MPLLVVNFGAGWSDTVYASDSSHLGYGVCYRELSGGVVRDLGRTSERWKYLCEGVASNTKDDAQDKDNLSHACNATRGAPAMMSRAIARRKAARISSGDTDCKAPLCCGGRNVYEGTEMTHIIWKRVGVWK